MRKPQPARPSLGSLLLGLILCLLATGATIYAGRYAYGVDSRILHAKGTIEQIELFNPGSIQGTSRHYQTQFTVKTEQNHPVGPLKLAGDQRDMLHAITGPVAVVYTPLHLVLELKDASHTYIALESSVRKQHIARALAVLAVIILGVFSVSLWSSFIRSLRPLVKPIFTSA